MGDIIEHLDGEELDKIGKHVEKKGPKASKADKDMGKRVKDEQQRRGR